MRRVGNEYIPNPKGNQRKPDWFILQDSLRVCCPSQLLVHSMVLRHEEILSGMLICFMEKVIVLSMLTESISFFYKEICSIKLLGLKSVSLDTIIYHHGLVRNFCDLPNALSTGVGAQYLRHITLLWRSKHVQNITPP